MVLFAGKGEVCRRNDINFPQGCCKLRDDCRERASTVPHGNRTCGTALGELVCRTISPECIGNPNCCTADRSMPGPYIVICIIVKNAAVSRETAAFVYFIRIRSGPERNHAGSHGVRCLSNRSTVQQLARRGSLPYPSGSIEPRRITRGEMRFEPHKRAAVCPQGLPALSVREHRTTPDHTGVRCVSNRTSVQQLARRGSLLSTCRPGRLRQRRLHQRRGRACRQPGTRWSARRRPRRRR